MNAQPCDCAICLRFKALCVANRHSRPSCSGEAMELATIISRRSAVRSNSLHMGAIASFLAICFLISLCSTISSSFRLVRGEVVGVICSCHLNNTSVVSRFGYLCSVITSCIGASKHGVCV